MSRRLPLLLGACVVIAAGVGFLDSMFTDEYDFAVMFGLLALLGLAQCVVAVRRPPPIEMRRDVTHWLIERSRLTGEPVCRLADRAVVGYRTGLGDNGKDDRSVTRVGR